jgi:hypothetical protein
MNLWCDDGLRVLSTNDKSVGCSRHTGFDVVVSTWSTFLCGTQGFSLTAVDATQIRINLRGSCI